MEDENDRLDEVIKTVKKYYDEIIQLASDVDKDAKKLENGYIGKIADILKILAGSMENPYDLDDMMYICRVFASHQMMKRIGLEGQEEVREHLADFYLRGGDEEIE